MNKLSRKDFLDLLAQADKKTRETSVSSYEGKVEQDQAGYVVEKLSFLDTDMTMRRVTHHSTKACSFGHLLDQKTRLVSRCEICQKFTCSAPGCSFTCSRDGRALCRSHCRVHGNLVFCRGWCDFVYWFRRFWGLD